MTVTILVCLTTDAAYGHLSPDNKKLAAIQEWNDQQNAGRLSASTTFASKWLCPIRDNRSAQKVP